MITVKIFKHANDFAEDKDIARSLRLNKIEPQLKKHNEIIIDFEGVTSVTQSFIHALISQIIRDFGIDVLNKINFKNCNDKVQTIIEIVVEYVQDGIFTEEDEELNELDP